VCIPFTAVSGDGTREFEIDNGRPAMQRTIGFWKNWASCSGSKGGQAPILDQTLAKGPWVDLDEDDVMDLGENGFWIGDLFVGSCSDAVHLLNKTPIDGTRNKASDPAFNVAAQQVAFQLNVLIPSDTTCLAANASADYVQDYLDQVGFTGLSAWAYNWKTLNGPKIAANLNFLSAVLDHYNNDTLKFGATISGKTVDCSTVLTTVLPDLSTLPPAGSHNALP